MEGVIGMDRVRGHRIAGPGDTRDGARHYWAAAVALIGIGVQSYGMANQPSGKIPTSVRAEMAEQKRRQDEAYRMQLLLQPFMLEQMGLEAVLDANGNMSGIRKRPKTKTEQQDIEIKERANEKVLKGLRGELDIDPGAARALNEADAQQKEFLARTLGPDYALSTAGGTALSRQSEARNITESEIRRGEMTAAEAIAQGRIGNEVQQRRLATGLAVGIPQGLYAGAEAMDFPEAEIASAQYRMRAGRAAGWSQLGSGLMSGAGGLLGAYLANQRRTPVYGFQGKQPPVPEYGVD